MVVQETACSPNVRLAVDIASIVAPNEPKSNPSKTITAILKCLVGRQVLLLIESFMAVRSTQVIIRKLVGEDVRQSSETIF